MGDTSWATDLSAGAGSPSVGGGGDEVADRTAIITAKLKQIYRKTVLPVEKKYQYDYFYESPLMTDVEFDGECSCFDRFGYWSYSGDIFDDGSFPVFDSWFFFDNFFSQTPGTSYRTILCR